MPVAEINLKSFIRDIPDFPKKDIVFKDITPLLKDRMAFRCAIEKLVEPFLEEKISSIACIEARGFIIGSAVSSYLEAGFIPIRKRGKLPYKTYDVQYALEYGHDELSIHQDAFGENERVLIVDDVLATGGTLEATLELLKSFSIHVVGIACLVELTSLKAREKLSEYKFHSVIQY